MKLKGLNEDETIYRQEMENALRGVANDTVFNLDNNPFSKEAIRQEVFDESDYANEDDEAVSILAKMVIKEMTDELLKHRDAHGYRMFIPLASGGTFTLGMWQRLPYVTCMDIGEYKGTLKSTMKVLGDEVKKLGSIEKLHVKLGLADDQPITLAYSQLTQ